VNFLVFIVLAFAIMWLFVLLPQRRRQAAHNALLASLEAGDEVLTAGGIYGRVRDIGDEEVEVEVAPGTNVRVATRAIAAVLPPDPEPEDPAADDRPGVEETTAGGQRDAHR
jgi:preprotein translocase subunit YajC